MKIVYDHGIMEIFGDDATMRIFCDGGTTKDGTYWSVAAESADGHCEVVVDHRRSDRLTTNNEAEYAAVMESFIYIQNNFTSVSPITVYSDSKLVVEQVNDRWKSTEPRMLQLKTIVRSKFKELTNLGYTINLMWCPREENVKRLGH
jgi:ribonuclease HI